MVRQIHLFDNGVKVYDDQLMPVQRDRYNIRNVHEADEEDIFVGLIRAIPSRGCFVNIGTAIGYYTILAKKISPELLVHAIEPLERHRTYLNENLVLNGLNPKEIILHNEGIYSTSGEEFFIDSGYGSLISTGYKNRKQFLHQIILFIKNLYTQTCIQEFNPQSKKKISKIKTITLDSLITRVGRTVDLLQIDVQGVEADVLNSGLLSLQSGQIKTLLIGTHGRKIHQKCVNILRDFDYIIEHDEYDTKEQPDGIIAASRGYRRLNKP